MNRWFYVNIVVILLAIWKINTGLFHPHIVMGVIGFTLVMFNWMRHAVFTKIRESPNRAIKIRYANISKRALPFHKWTGTAALLFILIHGSLIIHRYGFYLLNSKILTGFITLITLLALVISGWIRWLKTTVVKRYVHLLLGFTTFFLMIVHILI